MTELAQIHPSSPWHHAWALVRREWTWMLAALACVCAILLWNVRTNVAADYAVLMYEPRALPTLLAITHMQAHVGWWPVVLTPHDALVGVPEQLQSAQGALVVLWLASRIVASTWLIFLISYLASTMVSTLLAYVAFRVATCRPWWAWVASIAFGLLPARFYWPDLLAQWFVAVPLMSACIAAFWYRPQLWEWRQWAWYDWVLMTGVLCGMVLFGKSAALMAVFVLMVTVMLHRIEVGAWSQVWPLVGLALLSWSIVVLPTASHWAQSAGAQPVFQGVSLAALVLPSAHHVLPPLATIGSRYAALAIDHTHTYSMGVVAVIGLAIVVWRAVWQLVYPAPPLPAQRVTALVLVILFVANQLSTGAVFLLVQLLPFSQWEHASIWIGFWALQVAITTFQQQCARWGQREWRVVAVVLLVVLGDQVPRTTLLQQLPRGLTEVQSSRWQAGVLFSQTQLASDVVSVTGLADREPGYGRWSVPGATAIVVQVVDPIERPLKVHIRAKTDDAHDGMSVLIRIGDEQQTIVLSRTMTQYTVLFRQGDVPTNEIVIEVPPDSHTTAHHGSVFVQSLWAEVP